MVVKSENLPPIIKDSFITGLITLILAVPIVGLPTINATEGLQIEPRWSVVIWMVLAVFLGRLVLNFWWHREQTSSSSTIPLNTPFLQSLQQLLKFFIPIGVLFALILPAMPFASRYVMDVAILVITYIMLGWGLNIVVGLAGLLDLGYVAFYAIGAYSYALLANYFDWSFWICLPLAGVFAAISGILLGFPVLRLRGDYLAIVTLGFGEIIRVILLNWYEFTGGPDGISGIPRPSFFGLEFKRSSEGTFSSFFGLDYSSMHRIIFLYYLILALALLTNFITLRLRKLPVGRAWEALREDEIACRSLGINPTNTKLTAFAIGATFGGLAGSFFATRQGFISPESFTFIESAVILAIVVLGGMGSQIGVVLASVVLIGGTELFRELEEYRMLAFGALMVGIMVWKPRGLLAHREPTIRIKTEGSS
ncbi:MAG: high-affinity branched-chain amino acid ABC transporter permease LivM [SAR324 cluster bacterium]|nr:high-affinity branched-chain amino acid ABC transporter permease LivM [SAR324 cluster bacterium]